MTDLAYETLQTVPSKQKENFFDITALDIEKAILARIFELSHILIENADSIEKTLTPDKKLELEVDLGFAVELLDTGFKKSNFGEINTFFSIPTHADAYAYLSKNIKQGIYVDAFHVSKHLCLKDPSRQQSIRSAVTSIIDASRNLMTGFKPLMELCKELIAIRTKEQIKKVAESEDFEPDEITQLLEKLANPETKERKTEKIQQKVIKIAETQDTFQRALAKQELRLKHGFSPQEIGEMVEAATALQRPIPQIQTLTNFLQEDFGDSHWLYPDLIPANAVTMVSGAPGSMKTTLLISLLFAFLSDQPFLNEYPSVLAKNANNRGLIINSDQPAGEAQQMISRNSLAYNVAGKCDIINGWTLQDLPLLESALVQMQYKIVIIDSYFGIHSHLPDWDENKASAANGMKVLQQLAERYKVTIIVINHAVKGDAKGVNKSRGNGQIAATASCTIQIEKPEANKKNGGNFDPNLRMLEITKIRNAPCEKHMILFQPHSNQFAMQQDAAGKSRIRINENANRVYSQIFVNHPYQKFTIDDLAKYMAADLSGDRVKFATDVVEKLVKRGCITCESVQHDPRVKLYSWKSPSPENTIASIPNEYFAGDDSISF